jgi:hypothetical protein
MAIVIIGLVASRMYDPLTLSYHSFFSHYPRIEHLRMFSFHAKTAALFSCFSAKTVPLVGEMPQKATRIVYTKDAVNSVRARLAKVSRLYRRTLRHTDSSS